MQEDLLRALAALEEGRILEAEKALAATPDSPPVNRAWKLYLSGQMAIERLDLETAEPLLLQASSLGLIEGMGNEGVVDGDALRLSALALRQIGRIHRRRDRPEDAGRAHRASYHLQELHGSCEDMWETAIELGLDADLARRYADARQWHRIAVELAAETVEQPERKQAIAWEGLANSLNQGDDYDAAVEAARTAHQWWTRHDPGAVEAAKAEMKLGYALLRKGESLHDTGGEGARSALAEAIERLTAAREALLPFGPSCVADVQWCSEQKDFAERLGHSLDA